MYMELELDIDKDFVFTTDKNGCLKGGGFKIESTLLKNTINKKDNQTDETYQTGGGINMINGFKDLIVPAGLFYSQKSVQKNKSIHYDYADEEFDDTIYDKLLNMVEPTSRKKHGRNTKSNKDKKTRKTRKIKK